MKIDDIIKLEVTPVGDYEMEPGEVVPHGDWVLDPDNKYHRSALVKDVIGSKIRMRRQPVTKFIVRVFANPDGGGTVTGGGEYNPGEMASIGAVANDGFIFSQWQDGITDSQRDVVVEDDMNFIATFERTQITHNIIVGVKPEYSGYGTVSGGGVFPEGDSVVINAIPNEHCRFIKWDDNDGRAERIITVTQDKTYLAEFEVETFNVVVRPAPEQWGITIGSGVYAYGEQVTIHALAKPNYRFIRWNDGNTNPLRTIEVTGDVTYTATFERIPQTTAQITVTPNSNDYGWTNPQGTMIYNIGEQLVIEAFAREGYEFKHWDGIESVINPYTFKVTGDAEYKAIFESIPAPVQKYRITAVNTPDNFGYIEFLYHESNDGMAEYEAGDTCILLAKPASGCSFVRWLYNGVPMTESGPVFDFDVVEDAIVTAEFVQAPSTTYKVSAITQPDDGGRVTGNGVYPGGSVCTVTATPATGYDFAGWFTGGEPWGNEDEYMMRTRTFNILNDVELVAKFTLRSYDFEPSCKDKDGNVVVDCGTINITHDKTTTIKDTFHVSVAPEDGYILDSLVINGIKIPADGRLEFDFDIKDYIESGSYIIYVDAIFDVKPQPAEYNVNIMIVTDGVEDDRHGGAVWKNKDTYINGDPATVTATANPGYKFHHWERDGKPVGYDRSYSFFVWGDVELKAYFVSLEQYNIDVTANPTNGGVVTGGGVYYDGTKVTIQATVNEGFEFDHFEVNKVKVESSIDADSYIYRIIADGNKNVVAFFRKIEPPIPTYVVTTQVITDGIISDRGGVVSGSSTCIAGSDVIITARANTGFEFVRWSVNGVEVQGKPDGDLYTYTINRISQDTTVIAYFETKRYYTVTTSADPESGGKVYGAGTYKEGEDVAISTTTAMGYLLDHWIINGNGTPTGENPYIIKGINQDTSVIACFVTTGGGSSGGSGAETDKETNENTTDKITSE